MDKNESEEIFNLFLRELGVFLNRQNVIIPYKDFIFELPIHGNLVNVYLNSCYNCPVDCYKKTSLNFKEKTDKYIKNILKKKKSTIRISEKHFILLTKIAILKKEAEKIIELDDIIDFLKSKILTIRFVLVGLDGVGKSTILEYFPGDLRDYEVLVNTYIKINETFKPLIIELIDPDKTIIDNIVSPTIAPLIKKEFSNVYMFILVTDSKSKNILNTKHKLLPKLPELNPHALIICIANKQDSPRSLNYETVQNIIDHRTYPLIAIDSKSYEQFMKIIWETILLRIEQMQKHNCPLFET